MRTTTLFFKFIVMMFSGIFGFGLFWMYFLLFPRFMLFYLFMSCAISGIFGVFLYLIGFQFFQDKENKLKGGKHGRNNNQKRS